MSLTLALPLQAAASRWVEKPKERVPIDVRVPILVRDIEHSLQIYRDVVGFSALMRWTRRRGSRCLRATRGQSAARAPERQ